MDNSSEQKTPSIRVYLAEQTKQIEFTKLGKKFTIHPITMSEVAKIEDLCGVDFLDWETRNPFKKMSVMLFTLWLSLNKNQNLDMSQQQLHDMFNFVNVTDLVKLVLTILQLSGLEVKLDFEGKEGKEEGTQAAAAPASA